MLTSNANVQKNSEQQQVIIELAIKEINNTLPRYMKKLIDSFYKDFENVVFSKEDFPFWIKVQQRWGRGAGYREDMKNYYAEQIKINSFYDDIEQIITNYYYDYIDSIILIMNQLLDSDYALNNIP
ncbi:hypothetical protein CG775_06970 [Paenibacillus polymyxa]|nr:hypothetical protein CG775_06970 [Paenibacillus polymyxa]